MFGYNSFSEFITTLFRNVNSEFLLKYIVPIILGIDLLLSFVFDSVGGIWFLVLLYVIDFITGVFKSIKNSFKIRNYKKMNIEVPDFLEDKKLKSKKFPRFLMTMFAALLILGILSIAGKFSIVYAPLFSIFYAVFLGQQIISITENLYELGLVPFSIFKKITKKITDYLGKDDN